MAQVSGDDGDPRSYAIIGAAMEVHGVLGPGFVEYVYHQSLAVELGLRGIPYRHELPLPVTYKGQDVGVFRADFLCFDSVIVELKAQARLSGTDDAQIINYLRAAAMEVGLLLNFGTARLEYRRLIRSQSPRKSASSLDSSNP